MKLSKFGEKLSSQSGVVQLMDDLGEALSNNNDMLMLGGGNPGQVPAMQQVFRDRMRRVLDNGDEFERLVGNYGSPQGEQKFLEALAKLLKNTCGWDVRAENIALTNGSQSACFMLFNMFAGEMPDGSTKHIVLPLAPEYIGYSDQGLTDGFFRATRPLFDNYQPHRFKYHVDFDSIDVSDRASAICVSRPTNPTGNVLTDDEVEKLLSLAQRRDVPLIIDNAYGLPFPSIIFSDATPIWNDQIILTMSLSKLGLPGVRTGIVVAHPDIIKALSGVNAILNLTTAGFGPSLALDIIASGQVIELSEQHIKPFYKRKAERTVALLDEALGNLPYRIHKPEGAIFLWLWFEDLPIPSQELYERLKSRNALVLSGHFFFPGLEEPWRHKHECIRLTYSQDDDVVAKAVAILGEEVRAAYAAETDSMQSQPQLHRA